MLDTNKMKFIDAPLTSLPAQSISNYNSVFIKNKAAGVGSVQPHFYNKVSFLINKNNLSSTNTNSSQAGVIAPVDVSAFPRSEVCALGKFVRDGDYFLYPEIDDWILYYKLDKVIKKEWHYKNDVGDNPSLYRVCYGITNDYFTRESGGVDDPIYTPKLETGEHKFLIEGSELAPTPTSDYNNWFYVSEIGIYNRKSSSAGSNRVLIENCFPCVLWDLQTIYLYQNNMKPYTKTANFQGLTQMVFNDAMPSAAGLTQALWQLFDWYLFQSTRLDNPAGEDYRQVNIIAEHRAPNPNIAMIGATSQNAVITEWAKIATVEKRYWYQPISNNFYVLSACPVFKTEQDFLNLLADWGITRVTNNIEEAETLPAELLPDSGGGFVPDGGENSGFNTDITIANIPSFPDNTSDIIDIITPNISSINAANVYALSLSSTQNFLKWLLTDSFKDNISNLFTDKLSALNDLKLLPFDIVTHDTNHTLSSNTITLANVSTELPCFTLLAGYNCVLDGGNYHYTAYWGNYNDYTAATYYLYIPYGGIIELSPSHVVNCDLSIKYAIDLMTGNATAVIFSNGVLIKTIPCQMAQSIPITFTNTNQRDIRNALTALSVVNNIGGAVASAATGNIGGAVSGGLGVIGSVANSVMNNPLKVGSIGNFSNSSAFIMPQNAFLIISRIQLSIPSGLANTTGKPSNIYTTINNFVGSGFVQIKVTHINTSATTGEQEQLLNLLCNGIFI